MEIIEKAVEKIKEEIQKDDNPYMNLIGNYVLQQLEVNKPSAEKIVAGSKTLSGSLEEMEKEAKKVAKNGVGILTDEEGFAIVAKYFEFEGVQTKAEVIQFPKNEACENKPKSSQNGFSASLEDFI